MKIKRILSDAAVTVGCCVGVGMLSGKENQIFFGNYANIAFFCVIFAALNVVVRNYCKNNGCSALNTLSLKCFSKFSSLMNITLITCSFVCLVCALAGVQQCLSQLFYIGKTPLYAVACAAASSVILFRGMNALKKANVLSAAFAVIFLIILLCKRNGNTVSVNISPVQPAAYAFFSVTMSLGVITKLSCENEGKENVICSILSALTVGAILAVIGFCGNFQSELPTLDNLNAQETFIAIITLSLSAITGVVANAYPIYEELSDLIPDKTLRSSAIFTAALCFSAFGFDFAVKFGYILVSAAGLILIICITIKRLNTFYTKRRPR